MAISLFLTQVKTFLMLRNTKWKFNEPLHLKNNHKFHITNQENTYTFST